MKKQIQYLPNWSFEINEISNGVYKIIGIHFLGSRIEITNDNVNEMEKYIIYDAIKIEKQINDKLKTMYFS